MDQDIDIEYSHAVENDDLTLAYELARDYAKSKGYKVQAYHYSPNQFDEFTKGDIGFHFARDREVTELRKDDIDGEGGQVFNVALKLKKPFNIKYDLQQWTAYEFFVNAVNEELGVNVYQPEDYSFRTQLAIGRKCMKFLTSIGYKVDEIIEIARELTKTENSLHNPIDMKYRDDIISHMDKSGYDGFTYINMFEVDEDMDGLCYIVIHPNQIKSLDPQYDEDGRLMPLTGRFNQSDNRFTRESNRRSIVNQNESIMDSIKGIGRKVIDGVKNVFKDKPRVYVTNTVSKQKFTAYVNDYDEHMDICDMVVVYEANESLLHSAIQSAQSASSNVRNSSQPGRKPHRQNNNFSIGTPVIVNGEGFDNEEGKVIEVDMINSAEYIKVQFGERQ